jgi:hypothetical protein
LAVAAPLSDVEVFSSVQMERICSGFDGNEVVNEERTPYVEDYGSDIVISSDCEEGNSPPFAPDSAVPSDEEIIVLSKEDCIVNPNLASPSDLDKPWLETPGNNVVEMSVFLDTKSRQVDLQLVKLEEISKQMVNLKCLDQDFLANNQRVLEKAVSMDSSISEICKWTRDIAAPGKMA